MARDKGDEELRKKNGMERRKCYFALHVSVAHFAPYNGKLWAAPYFINAEV